MTFTNLEKYLYSKKCLKQRRQLSKSFNFSRKYGIRLNHGYLSKVDIVSVSTGLKGIINHVLKKPSDLKSLKFEYWRQNRIAERD